LPISLTLVATGAALLLVLAWDASGLDLALAASAGGANGFPLRDHWLWSKLLHDRLRIAAWGAVLWLATGLFRPIGVLRRLPRARVAWLLGTVLGAMVLVSLLKQRSLTSCPWDLREFGGTARHVSHWAWGLADGGPGRCFPGGHASAGFAWVAGFFAFRDVEPRTAKVWLGAALAAGALMGLAQQLRGAHFTSHTLWTAWLCWGWAFACSRLLPWMDRDAAAAG
jgi:membrane-associated PAP2 superfamily phosphatase